MNINTNMYATALYEAGITADPITYLDELDKFKALLNISDEIKDYFFKTYDQFDHVKEILLTDFSKSFINFLEIIYNNRSIREIDFITDKYVSLLMENSYLSTVEIYSSLELNVDKSILGGYIIKVNGDVYDTSIKNRLNQIRKLGGVTYE